MDPEEKMQDYYQTFLTTSNQTDNRSQKQIYREMSCGLSMMQTYSEICRQYDPVQGSPCQKNGS